MRTQKAIDKIVQSPVPPSITNVVWFDTINNLLKFYINGEWRATNDENSQADWDETDTASPAYINNKPTIPAAPVQSDWNESDTQSLAYIVNKPTNLLISDDVRTIVTCTLTEYGNISPKDPDTLYIILEDE